MESRRGLAHVLFAGNARLCLRERKQSLSASSCTTTVHYRSIRQSSRLHVCLLCTRDTRALAPVSPAILRCQLVLCSRRIHAPVLVPVPALLRQLSTSPTTRVIAHTRLDRSRPFNPSSLSHTRTAVDGLRWGYAALALLRSPRRGRLLSSTSHHTCPSRRHPLAQHERLWRRLLRLRGRLVLCRG